MVGLIVYFSIGVLITLCIFSLARVKDMIVEPVTWWKLAVVTLMFFIVCSTLYPFVFVAATILYRKHQKEATKTSEIIEDETIKSLFDEEGVHTRSDEEVIEFIKNETFTPIDEK